MIKVGQKLPGDEYLESFFMIVNEFIIPESSGKIYFGRNEYYGRLVDHKYSKNVLELTFKEAFCEILELDIYYEVETLELIEKLNIKKVLFEGRIKYVIAFEIGFEYEDWKKPYSFQEFADAMNEGLNYQDGMEFKWEQIDKDTISNGFYLISETYEGEKVIDSVITSKLSSLKPIYNGVIELLLSRQSNSLVSIFDFPEHVRIPCEQYLIFFIQFLKEIGIDATADIRHEAGKVLFSVTPTSEQIALRQIRQALEIYLQLPEVLSNTQIQLSGEINVQQLTANVHHLSGQLILADAALQAKNTTIENQQDIIVQQQKIIDTTILQQSLISINNGEKNDKENILGGLFTLTKYEGKGFEVDLASIYRLIRDYIRKR